MGRTGTHLPPSCSRGQMATFHGGQPSCPRRVCIQLLKLVLTCAALCLQQLLLLMFALCCRPALAPPPHPPRPQVGGAALAVVKDQPGSGIHFGPDGLAIPLAPGSERTAKCKVGNSGSARSLQSCAAPAWWRRRPAAPTWPAHWTDPSLRPPASPPPSAGALLCPHARWRQEPVCDRGEWARRAAGGAAGVLGGRGP